MKHKFKNRRYILFLLSIVFFSLTCSNLFWHNQNNHYSGVWLSDNDSTYYELSTNFERKKNTLRPGDMSVKTRNLSSYITEYKLKGTKIISSKEIFRISGDIKPDNLAISKNLIVFLHKDIQEKEYQLKLVSRQKKIKPPSILQKFPDSQKIIFHLSPDEKYIALVLDKKILSGDTNTEKNLITVKIMDLQKRTAKQIISTIHIELKSKGLPQATWWQKNTSTAPDFYIRDAHKVFRMNPEAKIPTIAKSYPRCFYISRFASPFSNDGKQAMRMRPNSELTIQKSSEPLRFKQTMIHNFSELGKNCP